MRCEWCEELLEPGTLLCMRCGREVRDRPAVSGPLATDAPPPEDAPPQEPERAEIVPPLHLCVLHPERATVATCTRCGRFICSACDPDLALRGSGRCEGCRERDGQGEYAKIGGWLILPAIGLALEIAGLFVVMGVMLYTLGLGGPDRAPWGLMLLLLMGALLVFDGFVASQFYPRKRSAPALMIASYALGLAVALVGALDDGPDSGVGSKVFNMARCVVWIAYFLRSERVKKTFVVD